MRKNALLLIAVIFVVIVGFDYYRLHPESSVCFLHHGTSPAELFTELPLPSIVEPSDPKNGQVALGVFPSEPQIANREISLPSGPGSFDVTQDAIAIADPVHLEVLLGHFGTSNGQKSVTSWDIITSTFPPVRVQLKNDHLLVQQYEGLSDNDLICDTKPLQCDVIAHFASKPSELARIRDIQARILERSAPHPSLVHDREKLSGWSYLGADTKDNKYYLIDYVGPAAAREGAFHFRKYSANGALADESPSLPEDNEVRILDRARIDDDGLCFWLSVRTDEQSKVLLREWRAR